MIPADILKKIKRLHIQTTRLANDIFAGEYKSVFKGKGLEFQEVREYMVGDEIRMIDWNVTARAGKPFIKKYIEERELTIMVLLDASGSNLFGSEKNLKKERAAELAALLAASANKNNDRVGLIIFTDRIETFIPPRKGTHHNLRIIREALYHRPQGRGTDIPGALEYLNKVTTRSTISFIISDFFGEGLKKPLSIAGKRHDIVAVKISDPKESFLPNAGIIGLLDPETGNRYFVDSAAMSMRETFAFKASERDKKIKELFNQVSIDRIDISTTEPYISALINFFNTRKLRRRIG